MGPDGTQPRKVPILWYQAEPWPNGVSIIAVVAAPNVHCDKRAATSLRNFTAPILDYALVLGG